MKWDPRFDGDTEHERRFTFMLVPLLGAIGAMLVPLPVLNRLHLTDADWVLPLIAISGMIGGSAGLLHSDGHAPDGRGGWGRVAALWLGFILLLPGAVAWGLRHDPPDVAYVLLAAGWVVLSALPFGRWETLSARQCIGFSARFYGMWLAVMLAIVPLPADGAGIVLALGYFASAPMAAFIRKRLS